MLSGFLWGGVSKGTGEGKADPDFALSSRVWGGEGRKGGKWGLLMMLGRGRKENAIDPHGPKTLNRAESSKFSTLLFQGQWREKLCIKKNYIKRYRGKDVGAPKITERL